MTNGIDRDVDFATYIRWQAQNDRAAGRVPSGYRFSDDPAQPFEDADDFADQVVAALAAWSEAYEGGGNTTAIAVVLTNWRSYQRLYGASLRHRHHGGHD